MEGRRRIYLGNLPMTETAQAVANWIHTQMGAYGPIETTKVIRRNRPEGSKQQYHEGGAHVTFESPDSASKAVEMSPDLMWAARNIKVYFAKNQPPTAGSRKLCQTSEQRASKTASQQRNRLRRIERDAEEICAIIAMIPPPPDGLSPDTFLKRAPEVPEKSLINWTQLPSSCDPCCILDSNSLDQVETFAVLLTDLVAETEKRLLILDAGCGSGNLILPLAFLLPQHDFVGLDMKSKCLHLLDERARKAGLKNISTMLGMVETMSISFDICLALHACGNATDYAMIKAVQNQASYIVSPCCVGKLKFSMLGGSSFHSSSHCYYHSVKETDENEERHPPLEPVASLFHPRSHWLRSCLPQPESDFSRIAKMADFLHNCDDNHDESTRVYSAASQCKLYIELDRNQAAREEGYSVQHFRTIQSSKMPKNNVLVGQPENRP